jgi:hypothetical protein
MVYELDHIAGLDTTRWERARHNAREIVRSRLQRPEPSQYAVRVYTRLPEGFTKGMLIVLGIIALAAFWISAGKQIAATDIVLSPIVKEYDNRLSTGWADVGIGLNLLLGELGTILFFTAAGIFPGGSIRWRAFEFKPVSLAFRAAGLMCATFAILANVTITYLHPQKDVMFYEWFLTLAPPFVVLFIGLYAERLLLMSVEARARAREAYEAAVETYQRYQADPESHPEFVAIWKREIFDQLMKVSAANRKKIEEAIQANPDVRMLLVQREHLRHEWTNGWQLAAANFTLPSLPDQAEGAGQLNLATPAQNASPAPSEPKWEVPSAG